MTASAVTRHLGETIAVWARYADIWKLQSHCIPCPATYNISSPSFFPRLWQRNMSLRSLFLHPTLLTTRYQCRYWPSLLARRCQGHLYRQASTLRVWARVTSVWQISQNGVRLRRPCTSLRPQSKQATSATISVRFRAFTIARPAIKGPQYRAEVVHMTAGSANLEPRALRRLARGLCQWASGKRVSVGILDK